MSYPNREESLRLNQELSLLNLLARKQKTKRSQLRKQPGHEIETFDGSEYPVLPIRDSVVFPGIVTPLFISRDRSVRAVEAAEAMEVPLLVVAQRDPDEVDPEFSDLYAIGTAVEIGRVLRLPDGSTTILVQGTERVRLLELVDTEPYLRVNGTPIFEDERRDMASEALMRAVLALFEKVVDLNPNLPEDAYVARRHAKRPTDRGTMAPDQ